MITILKKSKKGRQFKMKDMGVIQGSAAQAIPLIVGKDTVYEHTNIVKIEKDRDGKPIDNLFEFNEIQYEKDEYIKLMAERNDDLENQLTKTQLALVEIYEGMEV